MNGGRYISFTLYGKVVSKKNMFTPKRGGMYKSKELQADIDNLTMQVPGDVRDLRLTHPVIHFKFSVTSARRDRDNMVTTLMDILVDCGVLADDSIKHNNGIMVIHPATVGDSDEVEICIYPQS